MFDILGTSRTIFSISFYFLKPTFLCVLQWRILHAPSLYLIHGNIDLLQNMQDFNVYIYADNRFIPLKETSAITPTSPACMHTYTVTSITFYCIGIKIGYNRFIQEDNIHDCCTYVIVKVSALMLQWYILYRNARVEACLQQKAAVQC